MLRTKLFVPKIGSSLSAIRDYQDFIAENQNIKVISVNVFSHNNVLLTYED